MRRALEIVGWIVAALVVGCVWLDRSDYASQRANALNETADLAEQHDQDISDLQNKVSDLDDRVKALERARNTTQ